MDDINDFSVLEPALPDSDVQHRAAKLAEAMARAPQAPLHQLIQQYLAANHNDIKRPGLEAIANLNEGRFEDINRSDFRSYLVSRTGLTPTDLHDCLHTLSQFRMRLRSSGLLYERIAARDDA